MKIKTGKNRAKFVVRALSPRISSKELTTNLNFEATF